MAAVVGIEAVVLKQDLAKMASDLRVRCLESSLKNSLHGTCRGGAPCNCLRDHLRTRL
jgi:hypothetical protein